VVPEYAPDNALDPARLVQESLEEVWVEICRAYNISADLPELEVVFAGVDLRSAESAAETVLVNMLDEVIDSVGRFSPWYTKPARAFGLTSFRDKTSRKVVWMLAPEALQRWCHSLERLAELIEKNSGLIQAFLLVNDLLSNEENGDVVILAQCRCQPPRAIKIKRSVLSLAEIHCNACGHDFAASLTE